MAKKKSKADGYEVAAAYVSLYADTEGIAEDVSVALDAAVPAAAEAGEKIGTELEEGTKKKTKGLGAKIVGWGGFAVIGAAVGKMFASGLDNALAQHDLKKTMAANLGWDNADEYAAQAADLYALGWGESLEEVGADLTTILSEATDIYAEDLQELYPLFKGIAEQSGADLSRIVGTVSRMMGSDLVQSWEQGADVIATAYQSFGADSGEDILDTFTEYSGQFQALGLDVGTVLGLIQQGMHAGARNTDIVADSLKEFALLAKDPKNFEWYETLGMNFEDMREKFAMGGSTARDATLQVFEAISNIENAVEKEDALLAFFGTKSEDMALAIQALDPTTAADGFKDMAGSAQEMADASLSLEEQLQGLGRVLENALAEVIIPLLPEIEKFVKVIADGLGFFKDNPQLSGIILAIGGAIAVLAAAQIAFNIAAGLNPVILIIAGIVTAVGVLVGAIVWAANNWDAILKNLGDFFGWVGEQWGLFMQKWGTGAEQIVDFFRGAGEDLWAWTRTWPDALQSIVNNVVGFVAAIGRELGLVNVEIEGLGNDFANFLINIFGGFQGANAEGQSWLQGLGTSATTAFDTVWDKFQSTWSSMPALAEDVYKNLLDQAKSFAYEAGNALHQVGGSFIDGLKGNAAPKKRTAGAKKIPGLKDGGTVTRSGLTLVGEEGPEVYMMNRGSSVIPLPYLEEVGAKASGGGANVNVNIHNPIAEKTGISVAKLAREFGGALGMA